MLSRTLMLSLSTIALLAIASPSPADAGRYRAKRAPKVQKVGKFQTFRTGRGIKGLRTKAGVNGSFFKQFRRVQPVQSVSIGVGIAGNKMFVSHGSGKLYGASFHKLHYLSGAKAWVGQVVTKAYESKAEKRWSVINVATGKPLGPKHRFHKITERNGVLVAKSHQSYAVVSAKTGKTSAWFNKVRVNGNGKAMGLVPGGGWVPVAVE